MSTFRDIAESLANIQMEHFDPDNSYMALDVYVTMAKKALSEKPQSGYHDGYQDAAKELAAALRVAGVTGTVSDEPELTTVVLRWLHDNGEDI